MPTSPATPVKLVLKGICMGLADVIPGVSGGTMALILGIYRPLIDAIRSISLRRWRDAHWRFLIPLGMGIGGALVVGSLTIPTLMERYPEIMRGLFFGLILASIATPYRLIPASSPRQRVPAVLLALAAVAFGWTVTNPGLSFDTTNEWVTVTVPADAPLTLKQVTRRGPSAKSVIDVFWHERNGALRDVVRAAEPERYAELEAARRASDGQVLATDKRRIRALALTYNDLPVPPGTAVHVPRPAYWFVFVAGAVAICAMVLPGISGSFILLIFGVYFFILNAVKGSLTQLAGGSLPLDSVAFVALFITGILIGITSFSRVMAVLLHRFPTATMATLCGLMLGCLRGVWPYQETTDGAVANVWPAAFGTQDVLAIVAVVFGASLVGVMTYVDVKLKSAGEAS